LVAGDRRRRRSASANCAVTNMKPLPISYSLALLALGVEP
jgi:hypothetical protein